jgi:hypothetical protein
MEYWNDGIMGFGKMVYWVIGKVPLDTEAHSYKWLISFKTNPAKNWIFDFPIFHHSIIPSHETKVQASTKYHYFK